MHKISNIINKIRLPLWWFHLIPPILSVIYAILYINHIPVITFIGKELLLYIISIIGTAGFGYWLNDWTDLESDVKAGKTNHTQGLSLVQKTAILLILLGFAWLPWLFIPATFQALGALLLLQICFVLYSVPPFRCKERAFLGVLCDIHYGHVLPIVITLFTFIPLWLSGTSVQSAAVFLLFLLLYLKGFRNIVEHQLSDRKKDRKSNMYTFVIAVGPLASARLLSFVLVPLELLLIAVFLLYWSPILFTSYLVFLLLYAFLFQRWGVFRLSWRKRLFKSWYIANDFYESYLPIAILLMASFKNPDYSILILLHCLLFNKNFQVFTWFFKELKAIFIKPKPHTQSLT